MSLVTPRPSTAGSAPGAAYDAVAEASAALVLRSYSTSFGLACRLLAEPERTRIRNVYALVRVADELVDVPRPDLSTQQRIQLLDDLESEVVAAMTSGHSSNLVVHAFARTARSCGIWTDLTLPFFDSMRTDLVRLDHDQQSFERYVYGSAEVVGLMCLRVFVSEQPRPEASYASMAPGARRLGAAFQKINFLRDLAADHHDLGRSYFPGIDPARLTARQRDRVLDDIDADLLAADAALRHLPDSSRRAVRLAHALFVELSHRLRDVPVESLRTQRIRVPGPAKARIVARNLLLGDR